MGIHPVNILLIMTDQHALHAVGAYGAPVCRTPNIDGLAEDGILFKKAYTPISLCTPARASLLTGVYPHNHGAVYNTGCHLPMHEDSFGENLEIYPDALLGADYRIGYCGKWHAGIRKTASDGGFEGFGPRGYGNAYSTEEYADYLMRRSIARPEPHIQWSALGDTSGGMGSGYLSGKKEGHSSFFIADESIRKINEFDKDGSPWFMAVNFWGPHAPYIPTEDCMEMYDPEDIREWPSYRDDLKSKPFLHRKYRDYICSNSKNTSWDEWAVIVSRYYAQATIIDEAIGKLLSYLKNHGLYDSTMIIFTADHGETAGIHGGMFDKGSMAYEELYHIPLIVKRSGNANAGETRNQLVSLLDITPTICGAAGAPMPAGDGSSLMPILEDRDTGWRDTLVSEYYGHRMVAGLRIAWHKNYKYVHNLADADELYDLLADPAELENLIDDVNYESIIDEMRARMWNEMEKSGDTLGPQGFKYLKSKYIRNSS